MGWPAAAGRLKLRLQHPGARPAATLGRDLADGIRAVFVLDDGAEGVLVSAEDVAEWKQPAELLWRAARTNLEPEWEAAQRDVRPVPGGRARIFTGASPFVASLLLRLDDVRDLPPSGALVAVPDRHLLLVTPLASQSAAARIASGMAALVAELHQPGRAAINPHVFWWRFGAPLRPASEAGTP